MEKSKVYFTDFRTMAFGDGLPVKLKKLIKEAGIGQIDMNGKFVAIKMHFGELGNVSFLRPNYAKAVADVVKELGGKPFLTDCNTMYPGSRKNALEHLECAWENGFSPLSVGCPILIGDGLKGTDDIEVPVAGGEYVKSAKIGRAVMDADVFISLTHFKGHEMTGFGGAIKNIGMGCGSRAGKKEQHSSGKPYIAPDLCRACMKCQKECANEGLVFDQEHKKMTVDQDHCVGCGRCLGACNFDAIAFDNDEANELLNRRMAEYTKAVVDGRPNFHISLVMDVSPNCDCHGENDAPILPDLGMFASFDPLALDQACVDACLKAAPLPGSQLADNLAKKGFVDHHDHFINSSPESEWQSCMDQAEKIGLGTRDYELISVLQTHSHH
ncbi:MAG: 4Fe-4S ferredoxin iron-sulfur binding protein [Bacillota bacterium]|nr:4Fe-4S ferredoxin iron-sulfur binding protein [Bacillota bacterium]